MRMTLGDYCLATLRAADCLNWRESEGFYWSINGRDFSRLPVGNDLDKAKAMLLQSIPEPCRPFIKWEGDA